MKRGSHLVVVIKFYVSILLCMSPQNKKSKKTASSSSIKGATSIRRCDPEPIKKCYLPGFRRESKESGI